MSCKKETDKEKGLVVQRTQDNNEKSLASIRHRLRSLFDALRQDPQGSE